MLGSPIFGKLPCLEAHVVDAMVAVLQKIP